MRILNDCKNQFQEIINKNNYPIMPMFQENAYNLFRTLFAFNYLTNRIEVVHLFDSRYFNITHSCLLESFQLLFDNHPRGASLVSRSGLENFIKHVIVIFNSHGNFRIDEKVYINNKNTVDKIFEQNFSDPFLPLLKKLNNQLLTLYKQLSGLSHSLVPESEKIIIGYFSEFHSVNSTNIEQVIDKLYLFLTYLFDVCVFITHNSLKQWDSPHLTDLLSLVYGNKRRERITNLIRQN